jgi:GH24 family phage-related lysozyme (muramidase)|tara:strand:- start:883 stop:5406 length:4524 start_codon:yes stop_codon:yes gene_type:complete
MPTLEEIKVLQERAREGDKEAFKDYIIASRSPGYNLLESLFPKATKEATKFQAGVRTTLVNNAIDLGRTVVDVAIPESIDPNRQERRQAQEDVMYDYFTTLHGKDIIQRKDRYGITGSTVEPMANGALNFARDITGFALGFKGLDKLAKGSKLLKGRDKTRAIVAGEGASQLAFDPTDGSLLADLIGAIIPNDTEMLEDIEAYINLPSDSEERSRLIDRMFLLGDGLAFVGGFATIGAANKRAGFSKAFVETLNKLSNKSQETKDDFIKNIQKSSSENAQQVRTALLNRNKEIQKGKVKNEPVVEGQGDIKSLYAGKFNIGDISLKFSENGTIRTLEKIRRKLFTSRGNMTTEMYEKFLKGENLKEMHQDRIANIAFNLESTIDDIIKKSGKSSDELKEQINYVLFTDFRSPTIITGGKISLGRTQSGQFRKELNKLPQELREPIIRAREYQDKLSKLLVNTEYLSPEMKKIFADNFGFYVRRSYKAFEDANFEPSNDVVKRAKEYIVKQIKNNSKEKLTPDQINLRATAILNDFQNINSKNSFNANLQSFDRVRKEILKNKKEIPKEIRELLGEITDPTQKIIHSTTKLAKLLEDAKFYDEAFKDGIGIYFRRDAEGIFKEVIPEGFGPLSGKFTSKEMLSYFNGYKGITNELLNNELIGGVYANLMYLKGFSQAAKTIYSHTTHVKNVAGGVQMSLANGINVFDAKQTAEIISILRARTKNNKDNQEFHELLSELGLLNKGVVARDLQGLAGDLAGRKKGLVVGKIDWAADKIGLKKLANKAQNAYIAEDDFFKINMFIREEQNLKKINDLLPEGLQKTERQIQEEAAKIVRNVLPNYDLVPEFFKQVRAVPFMGRFFSFMSESVRITQGAIMQSRREYQEYSRLLKLGHEEAANEYLKRSGRRLGSFIAVAGTGAAATEKVSQALSGLSDAEIEAYKDMLPDYMKNSKIAIAIAKDGTPMIGNLSSWDAYDYPKKLAKFVTENFYDKEVNNEDFNTQLMSTIFGEAVSPFLGESMIAEPLSDYFFANGKTKTGGNMSFEFMGDRYEYIDYGDSTTNNIKNLNVLFGKVMTETLMPGSLDRLFDYTKTFGKDQTRYDQNIYETDQFVKFVTGWGMSPMNKEYLENIHGFKTTDYSKMKSQHRNNISNGIGDVLEYDKFINNYVDMNMLHYKNFTKYTKFNESAELLGLNTAKLMKDNGVSKADMGYVRQAKFKPLGVTDDMQLKMLEKDDNKVRIEIMRDIHRIDRILSSMPVLYDDNHYKIYKEDKEFIDLRIEDVKRKPKVTGGLITGPKVPNAKENSSDRVDPFTGAPYSDQMARLGLVKGGLTEDKLLNFILATEDVNLYQDYRKGNLDKIVKAHEGSKRFQEAHGKKDVPTIGGITGSGITQATVGQTVGMVRNRINEERNYLNKILPEEIRKTIPKNVQDSAVSLIFNVGQGAFKKSKAYQNLAQGNIEGFYKEAFDPNIGFTKITGADGTPRVDEGLVNRRRQELEFAQGLWQDPYKQ